MAAAAALIAPAEEACACPGSAGDGAAAAASAALHNAAGWWRRAAGRHAGTVRALIARLRAWLSNVIEFVLDVSAGAARARARGARMCSPLVKTALLPACPFH